MNASRVDGVRAAFDELGVASFLVTNLVNVRYLTGFESSNAAVIVRSDRCLLLTDGRYLNAAGAVEGVELAEAERELPAFLGPRLAELAEPPVAFESGHVTYAAWEALRSGDAELRPAAAVVERLRAVKDEDELEAVRAAARVNAAAYDWLAEQEVVGLTEAELAWRLGEALHDAGASEPAFATIAGAGPNAALPHHHPGERRIGEGETLIVDMGARLDGYASDCTRTFATGPLSDELARAYETCRDAQAEALAAVRAGSSARDVDGIARGRIAAAGYDVLHGLGHGVGLDVHELPRLADTSDAVLEAGNVVTVEPGVYLAGRGGVRIEDLVIVTDGEPEVLTPFTKELVTLG